MNCFDEIAENAINTKDVINRNTTDDTDQHKNSEENNIPQQVAENVDINIALVNHIKVQNKESTDKRTKCENID